MSTYINEDKINYLKYGLPITLFMDFTDKETQKATRKPIGETTTTPAYPNFPLK